MRKLSTTFFLLIYCQHSSVQPRRRNPKHKEKVIISFENDIDYEELETMGAEIHSELDVYHLLSPLCQKL